MLAMHLQHRTQRSSSTCAGLAVTFGGFVGLAASLPIYFTDQFHLTPVMAGYCTAGCVFAGSLVRPLGGALADRVGGIKVLMIVFVVAAIALAGVPQAVNLTAALGLFVLGYVGIGISFYPYIVPPSLTIAEAAAPEASLAFLLVGAAVLIPIILIYTAYAYWVFRGKVRPGEGYH